MALALCATLKAQHTLDTLQLVYDLQTLSADAMQGRRTGTPGAEKARAYIIKRFEDAGLQPFYPGYKHYFSFNGRRGQKIDSAVNLVGVIPGRLKAAIIVTAHYDHLGVRGNKIFNGADDNASGTATLINMAAALNGYAPEHTLIFAALDAEEMGLQGAKALVKQLEAQGQEVLLNLNMDMISRNAKNELYAVGTHHYPQLKPQLEAIAQTASISLRFGHDRRASSKQDWTYSSDHAPFHRKGIPFIYFGVEDHADYHAHTDTFDKVQPAFFIKAATLVLEALLSFDANMPQQD